MIQMLALVPWESRETYYILGAVFLAAYFIGSLRKGFGEATA